MRKPTIEAVATWLARKVGTKQQDQYRDWLADRCQSPSRCPANQSRSTRGSSWTGGGSRATTHFDTPAQPRRGHVSFDESHWLTDLDILALRHTELMACTGIKRWYARPGRGDAPAPPRYKTAILVFAGLYPLCLVLGLILDPMLMGMPKPVQLLVSLLISVPIMVWFVLPLLSRLFSAWLHRQ